MRKKILCLLICVLMCSVVFTTGCGDDLETFDPDRYDGVAHPIATIDIEYYGQIVVELYPETAPETVSNFVTLANSGFYDGLTFHRVIPTFMIQGGCPEGNGMGGPGYTIQGEFQENGVRNTLSHKKGVISMARANDPNSGGSQFFICVDDSPSVQNLDGKYAAFGKTISGIELAVEISELATDANDKPANEQVVIRSIRVDTKGVDYSQFTKLPV